MHPSKETKEKPQYALRLFLCLMIKYLWILREISGWEIDIFMGKGV